MNRTVVFAGILTLVLTAAPLTVADDPPLPDFFSLLLVDGASYVTPVKYQQGGTCWTHGTMASIESALLMNGNWTAAGDTGVPNLAEYHLDWWNGYNNFYNQDADPPDNAPGVDLHFGGDYRMAAAYLSRGEGAVREIDGQSYLHTPARSDSSYHVYYVRDIEWYTAGEDLSRIDGIKRRIMTDGAVATCIDADYAFMDQEHWIHYQPATASGLPTHAVTIVGWSDMFETGAPGPGAWLVKNSWGVGWANDGYFWISYYDRWAGKHEYMGAVSFRHPELLTYDRIYYHDYHGWRKVKTDADEAMNVFRTDGGDRLDAVSFYTMGDSVTYTVRIFDRFESGQLLDELSSESGFIACRGFHTVDLSTPVVLRHADDLFYIALTVSDNAQAYDCTAAVELLLGARGMPAVPSLSAPGESYYLQGGEWHDFYELNSTANFCIKGLGRHILSFDATPRIGAVPLEANFAASSPMDIDSYEWSFGDGATGEGAGQSHTYSCRGAYDITLTAMCDGESYELKRKEHVIAICDTLSVENGSYMPGEAAVVTISGCNVIPLNTITIPVEYSDDIGLVFDSVSVVGCRTSAFQSVAVINSDLANRRFTVKLIRSPIDPALTLDAGQGPLLGIYFHVTGEPGPGDTATISIDGYGTGMPTLTGPLASYSPVSLGGTITVVSCCEDKGNMDGLPGANGAVNVSDLTYLAGYLFFGGPPPPCMLEADLNGQTGTVDITDLTILVAYLFQGAQLPITCP